MDNLREQAKQREQAKGLDNAALERLFASENVNISYPAASELGRRMAEKREVKDFILGNVVNTVNKHALRHSFAALPLYIRHLKKEGKEEKIKFLTDYGNIKKSTTEEENAVSFFRRFLEALEGEGRRLYLENNRNKPVNSDPFYSLIFRDKLTEESLKAKIGKAIGKKERLIREEKQGAKPSEKKIKGLLKAIHHLETMAVNDINTITYKDLNKIDVHLEFKPAGGGTDRFREWVLASLVYSFYHLYEAFSKEINFFSVCYYLMQLGRSQISAIKNLPFFIADLNEGEDKPAWLPELKGLMERSILDREICVDQLHTGDFLKDFDAVANGKTKKYLHYLGSILPDNFQLEKVDKALFFKIREFLLLDEFKWYALSDKEKNFVFIYEYYILEVDRNSISRKLLILYRDLMSVYDNNFALTQFFLRLLKKLFFTEQEFYKDSHRETFFRICERQIFMVLKLLEKYDWKGTVEKDIASILIGSLDGYDEKYTGEAKKGDHSVDQLIYYIFFSVSSETILKTMVDYSKNKKEKSSVFARFLYYFQSNDFFRFDSVLLSQGPEREAEIEIFQLVRPGDLDKIREETMGSRFGKLFQWKYFADQNLSNSNWVFFKDYEDKRLFFEACFRDSKIRAEKMHHQLCGIIYELQNSFIDMGLIYKDDGYQINYEELELPLFMELPEKIYGALRYLKELEGFIIKNLPLAEKKLFLGEDGEWGVSKLESFLKEQREDLIEITREMSKGNENYFEETLFEPGSWSSSREPYLKFVKEWFFNRLNFKILLKKKIKRNEGDKKEKADNRFLWGGDSGFPGRRLLLMMMNPLISLPMILFPFLLIFFSNDSAGYAYTVIVYLFIAGALYLLFSWMYRCFANACAGSDNSKIKYKEFFLPKIFAMIFIAYSSMYYADALWSVTITQDLLFGTLTIVLMLIITYLILNLTLFPGVGFSSVSSCGRRSRVLNVMAIGLLESFFLNLFNGIFMTKTMTHSTRACFSKLLAQSPSADFLQSVTIYLAGGAYEIYPYIILIWTFQAFCIGVILQVFIQKDKIF